MSGITVQTVYDWLNGIAPFDTAEGFDNVGLLLGDAAAPVKKLLFCVDVTEDVVQEAVRQGTELIVSHHPLMFGGISRIDYTVPEGRVLYALLTNRMNVIAAHTNWDRAQGGISDSLAEALSLKEITPANEYVRVGTVGPPMSTAALLDYVKERIPAQVRSYGSPDGLVSRVAVAGGASGEFADAAIKLGAQAFIVGEAKHHELLFACGQGLLVIEAGHFATEAFGMEALYRRFQAEAALQDWPVQPLVYVTASF